MKKVPTPYLEDILKSIDLIEEYLAKIDNNKQIFEEDTEKQDSIIRRLEVIGEATKRLRTDFTDQFANIPWKKMTGMRDVLIHDYDEVDLELVWNVVIDELPELKRSINEIIATDSSI